MISELAEQVVSGLATGAIIASMATTIQKQILGLGSP